MLNDGKKGPMKKLAQTRRNKVIRNIFINKIEDSECDQQIEDQLYMMMKIRIIKLRKNLSSADEIQRKKIFNVLILFLLGARLSQCQCPINTITSFDRIGGVMVKDSHLTLLYSAPNSTGSSSSLREQQQQTNGRLLGTPITAECNNRCRRNARCRGFLVDYSRHVCYSVEQQQSSTSSSVNLITSPARVQLIQTQDRTAYFEKHCYNLPGLDCERAWIFERSLGYQIRGHDDKIIEDVPTRIRCQELCMNEREFKCRSGEYDYLTMQCRLSIIDKYTKPKLFQATSQNIDYFENQCVGVGQQCDAFDRFENMDLGRAEIVRSANSSEQCQQICAQSIKAFICRSVTWNQLTGKCYINSANTFSIGGVDRLISAPGLSYYQRNDCFDLQLECDHTAMTLNLKTNEPFRGRMYVRDDPMACETIGRSSLSSSLTIPFQSHARCATRELVNRFSSVVVVQQHPQIQRKSDRYIKLVCDFQTANKTVTSTYNVVANPWTSTALINATSFAPKIRLRITDRHNSDIVGAKLGDELYLNIEAETESVYDMVARSVIAKSGGAEAESIMLIDKDGCPTDPRIFPALKKLNRRMIRGKFDAFKFSTDVVVRFQVDVQFCLNKCPVTICDTSVALNPLAAIGSDSLNDLGVGMPDTYSAGSFSNSPSPTTSAPSSMDSSLSMNNLDSLLPSTSNLNTPAPVPFNDQRVSGGNQNQLGSSSSLPLNGSLAPYPSIPYGPIQGRPSNGNGNSNTNNMNNIDNPYMQQYTSSPQQDQTAMGGGGGGSSLNRNHLHQNHQYPSLPANQPANYSSNNIYGPMSTVPMATPSDPQVFEPRSVDSPSSLMNNRVHRAMISGHDTMGSSSSDEHKRRRRSAEPIPIIPTHVPLQGEIIIRDNDEPSMTTNQASNVNSNRSSKMNRQQRRERNGRKDSNGPSYDFNGKLYNLIERYDICSQVNILWIDHISFLRQRLIDFRISLDYLNVQRPKIFKFILNLSSVR